jgi:hypothetical protein
LRGLFLLPGAGFDALSKLHLLVKIFTDPVNDIRLADVAPTTGDMPVFAPAPGAVLEKLGLPPQGDLTKKGKIIGPMDLLISAQAKSKKLILVTNNVKEFERVEGIKIENWV